jgi:glycosyltransferase involved in cell wall biosynthesis
VNNGATGGTKIALVHDYLVERGGAEKVLAALHGAFPQAPIYTAVYDRDATLAAFQDADVRSSFLQRLGADARRYRALLPLYPLAFRSFDLSGFDVVISSASGFAKGVRPAAGARHVCYCYTPPRFLWAYQDANGHERFPPPARFAVRALAPYLTRADRAGARRVDRFIAISRCVAARIRSVYEREAIVLPPPIDCDGFASGGTAGDFFLVLSRLVPYKRIDVAIEAFNRNGLPLLVVGDGRDRARLESLVRSECIRFLGHVSQEDVRELLATCRALIAPAEEDFGMAALEANASARPVIAYADGGALDSVQPGSTGVLFAEQTAESLLGALDEFERMSFDPEALVRHARRFDTSEFQRAMRAIVAEETGALALDRGGDLAFARQVGR